MDKRNAWRLANRIFFLDARGLFFTSKTKRLASFANSGVVREPCQRFRVVFRRGLNFPSFENAKHAERNFSNQSEGRKCEPYFEAAILY